MGTLASRQPGWPGLLAVMLLSAVAELPAQAQTSTPLSSAADLRYGHTLYHYYQENYLDALTTLLVAEEQGGIRGHGDNPEIMEGGLALAYRMERYASDVLSPLLALNRPQDVRDAAWYYMAKLRYQNENWARVDEALSHISPEPEPKLLQRVNALRLNVILRKDDIENAESMLRQSPLPEAERPYFYFNIGSAFARRGQYRRALPYFEYLAKQSFDKEEYRALYDKAMTAAGYATLFIKDYPRALGYFSRVRISSSMSNRALLGYGWAAAASGDYRAALKPWLHLANSELADENNQEALIAVPYAYEQLGAERQALEYYQRAEQRYGEEINEINVALERLQNEALLQALDLQEQSSGDWLSFRNSDDIAPRSAYLIALFAQQQFQGSVQNLKDLLSLKRMLDEWETKIGDYLAMLDERIDRRLAQSDFLAVNSVADYVAKLRAQRDRLAQQLDVITEERDFLALASPELTPLIERVARVEENLDRLRNDPFIDEYEESAARYRGLLLWQASEQYSENLWQLVKGLRQADTQIHTLESSYGRVGALLDAAQDIAPYRQRLEAGVQQIVSLRARIDALLTRNEDDLREQVTRALEAQRDRVSDYLARSRLSVARLYDKALQAHEQQEFEASKARGQASRSESEPSTASTEEATANEAKSGIKSGEIRSGEIKSGEIKSDEMTADETEEEQTESDQGPAEQAEAASAETAP